MLKVSFLKLVALAMVSLSLGAGKEPQCVHVENSYLRIQAYEVYAGDWIADYQQTFSYDEQWRVSGIQLSGMMYPYDDQRIVYSYSDRFNQHISLFYDKSFDEWNLSTSRSITIEDNLKDTIITQEWVDTGWVKTGHEIYHYSKTGNRIFEERMRKVNDTLALRLRANSEYDSNDSLIYRHAYTFNHSRFQLEEIEQFRWYSDGLVDSVKMINHTTGFYHVVWYKYTLDEKNRVIEQIASIRDTANAKFKKRSKEVTEYIESKPYPVTLRTVYTKTDSVWQPDYRSKDLSFHHGHTKTFWSYTDTAWNYSERRTSLFDCLGNILSETTSYYDPAIGWVYLERQRYDYYYIPKPEPLRSVARVNARGDNLKVTAASGVIHVTNLPSEHISAEIFDLRGRALNMAKQSSSGLKHTYALKNQTLPSGIVVLRLRDDSGRVIYNQQIRVLH
ncbi:hypothetical protein QA601_14860 [Chitinispirillales bacterium ANBcel5]|uniref:hypothetical protein n=1 Tax=Cellulosispirillum alkaliphilum TaxID=3039283 RepID=UPI002A584283|nr:hypothetical protein [Chitinispirillales bacterium ANBcel5]